MKHCIVVPYFKFYFILQNIHGTLQEGNKVHTRTTHTHTHTHTYSGKEKKTCSLGLDN